MSGLVVKVAVHCSLGVGPARGGRANNEDNYLRGQDGIVTWREGDGEYRTNLGPCPHVLVAVADGMGGHDDGELASAAAVQTLSRLYMTAPGEAPEFTLRDFVLDAHRRLHVRAASTGPVKMGTTLTAAWVVAGRLHWVQVGDSRLHLFRRGQVVQITTDQTRGEFARRDGRPLPKWPDNLAQNFIYGSRGLGEDPGIRIDTPADCGSFGLEAGDRLALTTDGIHGVLDAPRMLACLDSAGADLDAAANALVAAALEAGSDDNATALLLSVTREHRTLLPHGGADASPRDPR